MGTATAKMSHMLSFPGPQLLKIHPEDTRRGSGRHKHKRQCGEPRQDTTLVDAPLGFRSARPVHREGHGAFAPRIQRGGPTVQMGEI